MAVGPLRAVQHLATRWGAAVTTAALIGACRSGRARRISLAT